MDDIDGIWYLWGFTNKSDEIPELPTCLKRLAASILKKST